MERLRSSDPNLDPAVVAHELKRPAMNLKDYSVLKRWHSAFRPLLTHEPEPIVSNDADAAAELDDADEPTSGIASEIYMSGEVEQKRSEITFTQLSFASYTRDLPALTNYLIAHGCSNVRYGIDAQFYHDPAERRSEFGD